MNKNIPVVFIHKGDHFYLNYSLSQVHITNPNNPIYLITDCLTHRFDFVKYVNIEKYTIKANEFEKIYKHMSTNSYNNELFCFQRWFILQEFASAQNLSSLLYLDSDILIYCDINKVFNVFNTYDFTISKMLSPHCCYFSDIEKLHKFCEFIPKLYTDTDYTDRFLKKHRSHLENNLPGGVCDMTAFYEYSKERTINPKDLSVIENNVVFDDNVNDSDGFEMKAGIKKLTYSDRFYYGTLKISGEKVKFNILHFQGSSKTRIAHYYLGRNFKGLNFKLRIDKLLNNNLFFYKVARKLGYEFY